MHPTSRPLRSSRGSQFESSRDVEIGGGEFNSTQGHHANFTINFNHSAMIDRLEGDDIEDPGNREHSRISPAIDHESGIRPIWSLPPLPVQRSCDIYYRHLAVKGRGSPLWQTEPSSTLPNIYRRQGITIGDVGIITASGGFDFMFNICLPATHPINQAGLPAGFSPLYPELKPIDIHRHMDHSQNSYLSSSSVERQRESDSSEIVFESSASEGAILTMPQGAHADNVANISKFRQYLYANAESWYRYVNDERGREARNGDVRLVIGCDKASSWGMATFANSTAQGFRLRFKPTSQSGPGQTYEWEYSGTVDTRTGPDPRETEALRSTDDSGHHSNVYENQCLFVRTLNADLQDDVWKGMGFAFETAKDVQFDWYPKFHSPSSSRNPSTRSPNPAGPSYSNSTTWAGSTRSSNTISLPRKPPPLVDIARFDVALRAHPSKTMNDFMLTQNPRARIAISSDDDWTSLIVKGDQRLPPPAELINRMLATHDVCEADGMVFLELKGKNKATSERSDRAINMPPVSLSEPGVSEHSPNNAMISKCSIGRERSQIIPTSPHQVATGGSILATLNQVARGPEPNYFSPPDFFSKGDGHEVSGGDFIATPGDSNIKYFADSKYMKITGGRYGTMDRTERTQSSGETSSNATRSSTFSQDGSDRYSHPSWQSTGKTEADQQDALSPYDRSRVRKGSGGSILAAQAQVANDPESYDTIQAAQSPPTSQIVPSSALLTNAALSSNKGKGSSSSHHRAGVRSDMGVSSSSRTNTAPPSSESSDNITKYVGTYPPVPPPPLSQKPEEYRKGTSYTGPPPTGQNSDLNREGSHPNPAPAPTTTGTGHKVYPYPTPPLHPSRILYESPSGSPEVLSQGYQSSAGPLPSPQIPSGHRQTVPFRAGAAQMGYPSPEPSPREYGGPYRLCPGGTGQRGYAQDGYYPQIPTGPTTNLGRRHGNPPFVLDWANSEPVPSHGDPRFIGTTPPMSRSITMPTPFFPHDPATAMTNPTSSPPYGGQYHTRAHDGSPSTDYTHHSGPPSRYPPAPHPSNYPSAQGNYYHNQGPPARSQKVPDGPPNPFGL